MVVLSLARAALVLFSAAAVEAALNDIRYGRHNVTGTVTSGEPFAPTYYKKSGIMCARVNFEQAFQDQVDRVKIVFTTTHFGKSATRPSDHDASSAWFDIDWSTNPTGRFDVCINDNTTHVRPGEHHIHDNLHVDYIAFEGDSPFAGAQGGRTRFPSDPKKRTFQGQHCEWVKFEPAFHTAPLFFPSVEHLPVGKNPFNHSDSAWAEAVFKDQALVCVGDAPVFGDTGHYPVHVNWMALEPSEGPPGSQAGSDKISLNQDNHRSRSVRGGSKDKSAFNKNGCTDIMFAQRFLTVPHVLASAGHNGSDKEAMAITEGDGDMHEARAITTWVEQISESGFRVCAAEMWYSMGGKEEEVYVDWIAFDDTFLNDKQHIQARQTVTGVVKLKISKEELSEEDERQQTEFLSQLRDVLAESTGVSVDRVAAARVGRKGSSYIANVAVGPANLQTDGDSQTAPAPEEVLQAFNEQVEADHSSFKESDFFKTYVKDGRNIRMDFSSDCLVTPWRTIEECTQETCGGDGGRMQQVRHIIRREINGGAACPALMRFMRCNAEPCSLAPQPDARDPKAIVATSSGAPAGGPAALSCPDSPRHIATSEWVLVVMIPIIILLCGGLTMCMCARHCRRSAAQDMDEKQARNVFGKKSFYRQHEDDVETPRKDGKTVDYDITHAAANPYSQTELPPVKPTHA
ncbi:unnamed protein product [Vitrella brassicaformis CCMP3155]|uniref:Spondin domain-containing protein n=2 Tax=Vitrella brassicaformis TaxID=1169539 RepID=A0A0G4F9V1_VITBC|nr:unnamed protein product [Vitrella brassicaformis CCMP3155]|mmetsp:Transcript_46710/g.116389  ORF Transcript_46710/g.116389 Transcript_46710/m.116389 type:complete len:687 (+) Transcript_46710:182-2242(+)|eukprot:CEM09659.1 unnamed protein product [Vitrella brassicaformis CCMP3155]